MAIRLFLAAFVLLLALPLFAQTSDALVVTVDVGKSGLDPAAIRREIAKELRRTVSSTPVAGAKGKLDVRVDDSNVSMTYETADGRQLVRVVKRPKDPSQELEVIALLAGNLARDEAADLLGEIGPKPESEPPPAPATTETRPPAPAPPPLAKKPAKTAEKKPNPRASPVAEQQPEKPKLHSVANLSLFHPVALYQDSHLRELNFELGLAYSRIGALSGVGVTLGALQVEGRAEGVGASIFWTSTKGGADGLFATAVFATSRGRLRGVEGSGIFNLREGAVRGVQTAGIFNYSEGVEGVQGAGLVNVSGNVDGVHGAGILNVTRGRVRGVEAALVNVSRNVTGLQAGVVNIAGTVNGVSAGLVNVSDRVEGLSLAPISILAKNRTQGLVFTDSVAIANIGVKYDTGPLYSLFTLGGDPGSKDDRSIGGGGAVGAHVVKEGHFFIDTDLMYRYFDEDPGRTDEGSHSTVLRGIVGWDFGPAGVFLGLGGEHRLTPENEHRGRGYGVVGLQLF